MRQTIPRDMAVGKRKRTAEEASNPKGSDGNSNPKPKSRSMESAHAEEVKQLEEGITESRRNYNNISKLLRLAATEEGFQTEYATVSLCRVFCRIIAGGDMIKSKATPPEEIVIIDWLKGRLEEYLEFLLSDVCGERLDLHLRLAKAQLEISENAWKDGIFPIYIYRLFSDDGEDIDEPNHLLQHFIQEWFSQYDDIRYYTLKTVQHEVNKTEEFRNHVSPRALRHLLSSLGSPPAKADGIKTFYAKQPTSGDRQKLFSPISHKKVVQELWLYVLRQHQSKADRKRILSIMSRKLVPWFLKPELLMDSLTDWYNEGGATSLLALSGLFHLIQGRNLDYPSFFPKLYSLLDADLLHSKHRSKVFRLLEQIMSSSHLPSNLVASFIKRLARLALHAPPGAIVSVIPWMYNMFRLHPLCTFMMHRETKDTTTLSSLEESGMDDPFDMQEPDPMKTRAIESSLWEIETLQSHYHPNVAAIAKIISSQFTKESYNLEDFLDHSYSGLIESELYRELKRPPVVEYEIPKRIVTEENEGHNDIGRLLSKAISFDRVAEA